MPRRAEPLEERTLLSGAPLANAIDAGNLASTSLMDANAGILLHDASLTFTIELPSQSVSMQVDDQVSRESALIHVTVSTLSENSSSRPERFRGDNQTHAIPIELIRDLCVSLVGLGSDVSSAPGDGDSIAIFRQDDGNSLPNEAFSAAYSVTVAFGTSGAESVVRFDIDLDVLRSGAEGLVPLVSGSGEIDTDQENSVRSLVDVSDWLATAMPMLLVGELTPRTALLSRNLDSPTTIEMATDFDDFPLDELRPITSDNFESDWPVLIQDIAATPLGEWKSSGPPILAHDVLSEADQLLLPASGFGTGGGHELDAQVMALHPTDVAGSVSESFAPVVCLAGTILSAVQSLGRALVMTVAGDPAGGEPIIADFVEPLIDDVDLGRARELWELKTELQDTPIAFTRLISASRHLEIRNIGPSDVDVDWPSESTIVAAPRHGVLERIGGDGNQYHYVPDAGYSGVDAFRIRLSGENSSRDAIVVIAVKPQPDADAARGIADAFENFEDWQAALSQ